MSRESHEQLRELTNQPNCKSPPLVVPPPPPPTSRPSRTHRSPEQRCGTQVRLKLVELMNPFQRGQLGGSWLSLLVLIQLLNITVNYSSQTNHPFKTSFVSSSDYSIRRNGALLSVPNVEQIQRDQADSIISPPAFEPTADDDNYAIFNRELNFLRDEQNQRGKQQPQQQVSSEPRPGDLGSGSGAAQVQTYLQVLDDLVASPSAESSTGRVEPNNNVTSLAVAVNASTGGDAVQEYAVQQQMTLPPQPMGSSSESPITTTVSSLLSSTEAAQTPSPVTTPTTAAITISSAPPIATTTTTTTTTTTPRSLASSSVAPIEPTTTAPVAGPSADGASANEQQASSNATSSAQTAEQPTTTTTTTSSPVGSSTTSASPMPENISSSVAPGTSTLAPIEVEVKMAVVSNQADESKRDASDSAGAGLTSSAHAASNVSSNSTGDALNKQAINGTAPAGQREARGRETICRFGDSNCNYAVATVPVAEKWKPTSGINRTAGGPTRLVNEFVLVPDDTSLSFEAESGSLYPTRRPGPSQTPEPPVSSLKAEHRTLDGEGGAELGEMDDIELDYILSDSEPSPLSGKSTLQPNQQRGATSSSDRQPAAANNRLGAVTEASIVASAAAFSSTRQPPVSTTSKPSLLDSTASSTTTAATTTNQQISTRQPVASQPVPVTTTAVPNKTTVHVSTSQSTSYSVRAVSSGSQLMPTRQTAANLRPGQSSSTTPMPSTTTRRTTTSSGRPNQKLMRIGDQSVPVKVEAKPATSTVSVPVTSPATGSTTPAGVVSSSTSASTTQGSTSTTTTTTSTTRRPAAFDWRRGEFTSGNRRPKSGARVSQHRQFFNEPVGDLRRKSASGGQPTPAVTGLDLASIIDHEEEEAAKILTRTISSQLSRLSASAAGVSAPTETINRRSAAPKTSASLDQRRPPARSSGASKIQKSAESKRLSEQQPPARQLGEERPVMMGGAHLKLPGPSPVDDERQHQIAGETQFAIVGNEQEIWTKGRSAPAPAATSKDEMPIPLKASSPAPNSPARSPAGGKQELAIEQPASRQQQQPQAKDQNRLNHSQQVVSSDGPKAPKERETADLHRGSNSSSEPTPDASTSLDNERAADRQTASSQADDRSPPPVTNSSSGGHTSGGAFNRLLLPPTPVATTTTTSSSSTTLRPIDTQTTTGATSQVSRTPDGAPTLSSLATSLPSSSVVSAGAMTKSDSARTMATTTTTITPTGSVGGDGQRSLSQVFKQATEELMTLIAQSEIVSSQPERPSLSLLQDRQVRAEPRATEKTTTTTAAPSVRLRQPQPSKAAESGASVSGVGRRQQVDNGRLNDATIFSTKSRLADELDEYEGSIEDQLAKDALHYQAPAAANVAARKTNSYTLKVKHSPASSSAASVVSVMDSGKWQPSASDESAALANANGDDSGQAMGNPLPGRPGIDYPIHWQVPKTSFDCRNYEQSGFYADVESDCQAYHSCHKGRGGRHTFLCPNGTLFSQELLTCDWWYNVECSASKLYLTNEGNSPNSLDNRAHFGDTTNSRANTNELSM